MKAKLSAKTVTTAIIGTALFATTLTAQAGEPVDADQHRATSMAVQYGDLNLANPEGVERLYQRLRSAAAKVCGPGENHRNMSVRSVWEQCYGSAIDDSVADVGHPALTRHHFEQTGQAEIAPQVAGTK